MSEPGIMQDRDWDVKLSSEDITILVVLLRGHAEHTRTENADWSARLDEMANHLIAATEGALDADEPDPG